MKVKGLKLHVEKYMRLYHEEKDLTAAKHFLFFIRVAIFVLNTKHFSTHFQKNVFL